MSQSLSQVWLHVVFSTKERRAYLQKPSVRTEMFKMLSHSVCETGCLSGSVGGYVDHVHLLVGLSRTLSIAKLVEQVKKETSRWIKSKDTSLRNFSWQTGYGAFSVSHSNWSVVDDYIRNQEAHHGKQTFQEEFRKLCARHGVKINEKYVWD